MKRGEWLEILLTVVGVLVGMRILSAVVEPATVLWLAAGSTVVTAIVLWFFFRSVRRGEERLQRTQPADPDVQTVAEDASFDPASEPCVLVSAGCTTGWMDWIHGELWVCADGLVRRSVGVRKTIEHGSGRTVEPGFRPKRVFTAAERYVIGNQGTTNRWIAWDWINSAETRRGIITDSLHYRLKNGSGGKLLWPRIDGGKTVIEAAARANLGERFIGARD